MELLDPGACGAQPPDRLRRRAPDRAPLLAPAPLSCASLRLSLTEISTASAVLHMTKCAIGQSSSLLLDLGQLHHTTALFPAAARSIGLFVSSWMHRCRFRHSIGLVV
ncbi:hypothetical protein CCMA1212_004688 [Trichoderma ghanense]|uniref:Uncharacterized protein n=1 Tax=Trichoderma ghanense TaxID=65468 RepID=A0ABY2H5B3_9HYPO